MGRRRYATRSRSRNKDEIDGTKSNPTLSVLDRRAKKRRLTDDVVDRKVGNPGKYKVEFAKQAFVLLSEHGLTLNELAKVFDVNVDTIHDWKRKHKMFAKAVRQGRDVFDSQNVEDSLLKRALGYDYDEIKHEQQTVTIKFNGGEEDFEALRECYPDGTVFKKNEKAGTAYIELPGVKVTLTKRHVPGDPKSQQFWLTNRDSKRWQNTQAIKVEGEVSFDGSLEHSIKEDMTDDDAAAAYHALLQGRTVTPITGKS